MRPYSSAIPALFLAPLCLATDFYVSPAGSDSNSGTSTLSAWKTIAKVNARAFAPGDRILFEGGQTFAGSLNFDASDAGTAANPITITSYGTGRATINGGTGSGLFAYNTGGFLITNLNFTGAGAGTNTKGGVEFYADVAGNVKFNHIYIDNVAASGFRHGIIIGAWNGTTGFNDVRVTNCESHHNQRSGLSTYAAALYGNSNVYVGHCSFHDNLGDSALAQPTGNGIVLGEVDGGTIERCVAYNNGIQSAPGQGPVGIWAYDSNNIVIQFNESYANRTSGTTDGGGFDLDIAMTNSVMQYNYSHDNDGAGYGLYQGSGVAAWNGNVVRYNVSQNDGRKNSYGAITVWTNGSIFSNCEIYGNTIYLAPSAAGSPRAIRFNSTSTGFHFRNNLILATGGLRLVEVPAGQTDVQFQGNDYYTYGGAFSISWNGTNYTSLSAFATATGQEKVAGTLVGKNVDPLLSNPGGGPTIGFPDLLETLTAYRLQSGSPVIDAGVNLMSLYGLSPGARDYYGNAVPQGAAFDIGAHESETSTPNQAPAITSATATPSGATAALSVTATDDRGEAGLVYTWSVVTAPTGAAVTFSANGTNAAKSATATFTKAGAYTLRVTATDAGGLSASADVPVTFTPAFTSVTVTPATASVKFGATQQFAAGALDQFNSPLTTQPSFAWSITGTNTITQTGLATGGTKTGTFTVTATSGGKSGTAKLTVTRK